MGCFDSVFIDCPKCGTSIEFQTKEGQCTLRRFKSDNVPADIAEGISGQIEECPSCESAIQISKTEPLPRVAVYARKIKKAYDQYHRLREPYEDDYDDEDDDEEHWD